jgi:NAD(P)-dependent dehydrogenase (short-subunit alcohol dehydrogenase family)
MKLEGIAVIVTGGASGLGAATARELASRGAHVVIADISDEKGKAVAAPSTASSRTWTWT